MTISDSIQAMAPEVAAWRRDIHRHPELQYDVHRTAGLVADLLRQFGCDEVVEGIGRTGVVGVIHGRPGPRAIGMRADMDALPIEEATGLAYASTVRGKMHACGHDGHTAMLLGAAKNLARTRNFTGDAVVIFQPAEEGGAGGKAMLDDGLMDRFAIEEVYGMHNMPGIAPGHFALRPGPLMASSDVFDIEITGKGAHAASPHNGIDPILVAAHIVTSLQSVVSRNADPLDSAVISVTSIRAGETYNVIPGSARLQGTCRALTPDMRDLLEKRLVEVSELTAQALGASAKAVYKRNYPVTRNHASQTKFCAEVARRVAGFDNVDTETVPVMGAEDFSFMLEARPGAFIFIGNGNTAGLHNPSYDFNDAILPAGISYWTRLAEARLAQ
ncbi:M20 aminoacylase family protein [Labrys monachus]|uniref:Hippurate hydrolase n=1 Tax=Labrys monachus TaxID=217067 RepID=A0ABU0FK81_9HYPH|nr:M20 aminoacylase family protein [Labrys monachus]MDQ0394488.1 hippurate hydrolase [Labrys monachus]